jgi:hypothetical protein
MRSPAVACLPVAIALIVFFARTHAVPLTGDEPHYLIMADSIASDHDLDLHNNYLSDFDSHRIYGLTIPHVYNVARGWMPYHYPGLSLLIAVPFRIGGIVGVRVALCLAVALLPWSVYLWLRTQMPASTAAWITLGLTIAEPVVFGAAQIYPDLIAGIIVLALVLHPIALRDGGRQSAWSWGVFWLAAGLLPWLHMKFLATSLLLALGGAADRLLRGDGWRPVVRTLATAPAYVVGPALLAAFNVWASGSPFGFHRIGELTTSFGRGAEIFLGLHFDQSQGMFVQQPLLLCGLVALPLFVWRRPALAAFWALVYLSLIVPNALELARYGGGGPSGRFGWSAAWLWIVPIGFAVADREAALAAWVKRAAIVGWCYQAALAIRWLHTPDVLFPVFEENLAARDSLFPVAMRRWLPSFYLWDFSSYWRYPPNVTALIIASLLVVFGAVASMRATPQSRLRSPHPAIRM